MSGLIEPEFGSGGNSISLHQQSPFGLHSKSSFGISLYSLGGNFLSLFIYAGLNISHTCLIANDIKPTPIGNLHLVVFCLN